MSLELRKSNDVYCTARSKGNGKGLFDDCVFIGEYNIHIEDFCSLVEYVFTNTDLEENDVRIETVEIIIKYIYVNGFNPNNFRYEEDRDEHEDEGEED